MINSTFIVSEKDQASMNMLDILMNKYDWKLIEKTRTYKKLGENELKIIILNEEMIYCENIEKIEESDRYIFLSRHVSEKKMPALTAHFLGNPSNDSPYGGKAMNLAYTCPNLLKNYMINLYEQKNKVENYEITLEATHHGPTNISKPCLFVEIGSQSKQWQDSIAGEIVINSIIKSIENEKETNMIGYGFGGPHYSKKFTKLIIENKYSISGYISRHYIKYFNQELLSQILNISDQKIRYAFIDKKGLGKDKQRIINLIKNELEIIYL